MQVYKVFFRILNKQKGMVIMYLFIFLGVSAIVSTQGINNEKTAFETASYNFSVFDEDNSDISRSLVEYLERDNERVEIADDKETIQDELYSRTTNCVIRIPKGFGKSIEGNGKVLPMEMISIPGTFYTETFKNMGNQYISLVRSYMAGGFPAAEALKKAESTNKEKVKVDMSEGRGSSTHSRMYYFFAYVPYIFISVCVVGIGPILIVFHRKELQERNSCSSYSLFRTNVELFAGTVTAGLGLLVLFLLLVFVNVRTDLFTIQGLFHAINIFCFLVVTLGIVFILGQILKKTSVLSMLSNVIGLGMSFLGGVFVPLEFLGDGIIQAAHFLPSYWYILAVRFIDTYKPGDSLSGLWTPLGIELLFGTALFCVGLAYAKTKQRSAEA